MTTPTLLNRRAQLPAWIASTAVHATLLLLFVWVAGTPSGREQSGPVREVGIVLREPTRESLAFDPPTELPETDPIATAESAVAEQAILPTPETPSPFAGLLEELTAESPPAGPVAALPGSVSLHEALAAGEVRVSVFGVEGTGSRFVYAFDRSISMQGPPLSAAKRQLVASLDAMGSIHQFQILFFNHRLSAFDLSGGQGRVAFATEQNRRRAADYIAGVTADGSTDRYAALARALSFSPDAVFFLTDVDSPMPRNRVERILARSASLGTTINTIEFGQGPQRKEQNFLIELATRTGGQHGYVDTRRLSR